MTDLTAGVGTFVLAAEPDLGHNAASYLTVAKDAAAALVFHPIVGIPAAATLTGATLTLTRKDAGALTPTLSCRRLDAAWGGSQTTWNNRPGLTGATTTLTQASSTAGDTFALDVLAQVLAGQTLGWTGLEVDRTDVGAAMTFHGFTSAFPPMLTLTFTTVPAAPTNLRPSGGRAVATTKPTVRWDGADVIAVQVQVDLTAGAFTSPLFDSGTVVSAEPELDLSATAFSGLPSVTDRTWRARQKNSSGVWSAWSDVAHFSYQAYQTFTFAVPSSFAGDIVNTDTPTIKWSVGVSAQVSCQVLLAFADDPATNIYDSGTLAGNTRQVTIPEMVIRDSSDLLLTVMSRDSIDRESVPGFPATQTATKTFSFQGTSAIAPPETLLVTQIGTSPFLDMAWRRADKPDSWQIRMDGLIIAGQSTTGGIVEGADGLYHFICYTASGGDIHHFRVEAKVGDQVSSGGPTQDMLTFPTGIWLGNPNTGETVLLHGDDPGDWDMGEVSAAYYPLRGTDPVRVTQALRGYDNDLRGFMIDDEVNTARQGYRNLAAMKATPAPLLNYVVAFPFIAFEALLSHVVMKAADWPGAQRWDVTLHVEQQGDLLWLGREAVDSQLTLLRTIDYEEGTDGVTITTLLNPESHDVSGVPKYETDAAQHGIMGMRIPQAINGGWVSYPAPYIGTASVYFTPRLSSGAGALVRMDPFTGVGNSFYITLRSGGDLDIADGSGATAQKSHGVFGWTLNRKARCDFQWTWDPTALMIHVAARLFTSPEAVTASDEWEATFACPLAPGYLAIGNGNATKQTDYDTVRIYSGNSSWPAPLLPGVDVTVVQSIPGALTANGATVVSRISGVDTIQLAVSATLTGGDPASPTYFDPDGDPEGVLVSAEGMVSHTFGTGAADTTYYARLSTAPGVFVGDLIQFRTLPAFGTTFTRKIALVSCQRNADGSQTQLAWEDILAWGPHDLYMIGDSHYAGGSMAGRPWQDHLDVYSSQLTGLAAMKQTWARAGHFNLADDHEYSADNGDSLDDPTRAASIMAMQETFPMYPLADSRQEQDKRGLYGSYMLGQHVRVIFLDTVSLDRSAGGDTDNSSKTFLGAEQDAWLRDQLVLPAAVNLIVCGKTLLGDAAHAPADADKMWNYSTWRSTLAAWIAANETLSGDPIKVGFAGGDRHAVGHISGAHNPIVPGAPAWMSSGAEMKALSRQAGEDWDADFGYYDHLADRPVVQWMEFTVTDTVGGGGAGTVSIAVKARQSTNTWSGSAPTDPATWTMSDGLTATDTWTYTSSPGFLVSPWAGDATQSTIEVTALTTATTSVGLKVSINADMSAAVPYTAAAPDSTGFNKWSVTGLPPGHDVYYQFTDTPAGKPTVPIGAIHHARTLTAAGVDCTIKIAVGACQQGAPMSPNVWNDMLAWGPDRIMHLGDFGYPNYLTTSQTTHKSNWARQMVNMSQQALMSTAAMDYITSDHDVNGSNATWPGGNGANHNDAISATNLLAWAAVVPARLVDVRSPKRGRYRSEVEGRVRFVKLDTRSQDRADVRQNGVVPADDPTMLGATQLAWLEAEIDAAQVAKQLVVIFTDPAWNGSVADVIDSKGVGTGVPVSYSDKWPAYALERDRISDYADARGVPLFIAFSDSHLSQQDTGDHEKNGFATICCGPFDQNMHGHFQDSYDFTWPHGIGDGKAPKAQMYQRLTIVCSGSTVTVTAQLRDCRTGTGVTPNETVNGHQYGTMTKVYNFGSGGALTAGNPGNQTSTEGAAVNLQLTATGGVQPYTWDATGLPPGLSLDGVGGLVFGADWGAV